MKLALTFAAITFAAAGGVEKVTVCHKGKRTITVGAPAVPALLAQGSTLGACPAGTAKDNCKAAKGKSTFASREQDSPHFWANIYGLPFGSCSVANVPGRQNCIVADADAQVVVLKAGNKNKRFENVKAGDELCTPDCVKNIDHVVSCSPAASTCDESQSGSTSDATANDKAAAEAACNCQCEEVDVLGSCVVADRSYKSVTLVANGKKRAFTNVGTAAQVCSEGCQTVSNAIFCGAGGKGGGSSSTNEDGSSDGGNGFF